MMVCKDDRDTQCTHDCPDCCEFIPQCIDCGEPIQSEDVGKYRGGKLCFDCFCKEYKLNYIDDFFSDNEDIYEKFKEYIKEANS